MDALICSSFYCLFVDSTLATCWKVGACFVTHGATHASTVAAHTACVAVNVIILKRKLAPSVVTHCAGCVPEAVGIVTETVDAALICFGLVQPSLAVRGQIAYIIVITNSTTVVRGAAVVHRKGESVIAGVGRRSNVTLPGVIRL